jgi:hypothetical protein
MLQPWPHQFDLCFKISCDLMDDVDIGRIRQADPDAGDPGVRSVSHEWKSVLGACLNSNAILEPYGTPYGRVRLSAPLDI